MERLVTTACSQAWLSLFGLFESASGLKLRINVLDTAIIKDGRLLAWFFTSRDGVVVRASNHEISPQAIYLKLAGSQGSVNANLNPFNYVALAHFESGVSRPLKQGELHQLVQNLAGPYDASHRWPSELSDRPFAIQAYVPPLKDLRYIALFGGLEGLQACTTFARRFSLRYTHAFDSGPPAIPQLCQGKAPCTVTATATHEPAALTAEEMLVESQLVALGLLEPRDALAQMLQDSDTVLGAAGPDTMVAAEASLPVSKAVKAEVQRIVQTLQSFIERAHGLRMQGMVAEFLQPAQDTVVLLAVHAAQWDSRSSRGRLGTFTERWADFLSGTGPAPAARPTSKRHFAPAMLASSDHPFGRYVATPSANDAIVTGRGYPWGPNNAHHNETVAVYDARPGSAPTVLMQRYRPSSAHPASAGTPSSKANTAMSTLESSYALWMPRETLATDTIAGTLALELEVVRDRLQRQIGISSRAEAALSGVAANSKGTHEAMAAQVEDLKAELAALRARKEDVQGEYERLRSERQGLKSEISTAREELKSAKAVVEQERATLSSQIRSSQSKEDGMEDVIRTLRTENEDLLQQVAALQRRADEGSEVIDAIKSQLLDMKQLVAMLQSQLRRGKANMPTGTGADFNKAGGGGDDIFDDSAGSKGSRQHAGVLNRSSVVSQPGSVLSKPVRR